MNILSLFDGISCARIALNNLGYNVDNYFASEIDKNSISVAKKNFPDIKHLGDIRLINLDLLPKIDLLIGGSPCQDLSIAQNGKGLEGEKSSLFYDYITILKQLKPKYFLLENVKSKWSNQMSEIIGVPFIEVNSAIFSAQSRPRLYWTNIDYSPIPKSLSDKKINDILCEINSNKYTIEKQGLSDFVIQTQFNTKTSKDGINKIFEIPKDIINDNERQRRVYSINSKSPTVLARADTTKIFQNGKIRKLTPIECERLQCIPDNYTSGFSDTQRYKMIGNAFTVSVIEHFLRGIENKPKDKIFNLQNRLFNFD